MFDEIAEHECKTELANAIFFFFFFYETAYFFYCFIFILFLFNDLINIC